VPLVDDGQPHRVAVEFRAPARQHGAVAVAVVAAESAPAPPR
jgi:hypothetical protein